MYLNKDKLNILSEHNFLTRYNQLLNELHEGKQGLPIILEKIDYNPKHFFRRTGSDPGFKTKFQENLNLIDNVNFPEFKNKKKPESKNEILLIKGKNRDWLLNNSDQIIGENRIWKLHTPIDIKSVPKLEIQGKKRNWKVQTIKRGGKKSGSKKKYVKKKTRKNLFKF